MQTSPSKIVFLYDKLMTKDEQLLMHLPIRLLSYGYIKGKMYWLNDGKRRRYFVVPPETKVNKKQYNTFVYGGIFVINDFKEYEQAVFSYYNSSISYYTEIMQGDLYIPQQLPIVPIKFKSIKEFEECRYISLPSVEGLSFLGNIENERVQHSLSHGSYYRRMSGIDVPNFLTMIVENKL